MHVFILDKLNKLGNSGQGEKAHTFIVYKGIICYSAMFMRRVPNASLSS